MSNLFGSQNEKTSERALRPAEHLRPRVPRCRHRGVDDHVYRDQVGHGVVGGSHRAQNPLPSLQRGREDQEKKQLVTQMLEANPSTHKPD